MAPDPLKRRFPVSAGILFGLGLGGFFDGIVLHQVLQWHHMLSGWYPITDLASLELNTRWDGVFHSTTYLFVIAGLFLLCGRPRRISPAPLPGAKPPIEPDRRPRTGFRCSLRSPRLWLA